MRKLDNSGSINVLLIPFIITLVFFLGTFGFAMWAYSERSDYKNNVDEKIATAVQVAKDQLSTEKDNEFIEREKEPLKDYKSPAQLSSVSIKYPKTWSAYVDEGDKLNGYFSPGYVKGTRSGAAYALRIELADKPFDEVARSFDSDVKQGKVKTKAYKPVNVKGVVGLRIDGEIDTDKQGVMILIPLREKTLKLWTESDQYKGDLEKHILPNFNFAP